MNNPSQEYPPAGHVPGFEIKEILVLDVGNREYVYTPRDDTPVYESGEHEEVAEDCNAGPECVIKEEDAHIQNSLSNTMVDQTIEVLMQGAGENGKQVEDPSAEPSSKKKRGRRGKGGRADDDVWNYFTYNRDKNGKKVDLKCIYCHYRAKWPKIERLRTHYYESCPGATQDTGDTPGNVQFISSDVTDPGGSSPNPVERGVAKLMAFRRTKNTLDMQIGRFIFSSNLPFSVIENPEFVKLIKTLKPSYKLPTKRKLETYILDKVYEEVVGETCKGWDGKYVTVMQDGWAGNGGASSIITHTLSLECRSMHFLNAVAITADKKCADYCATLLLEAAEESERTHKCKVVAVVTDNTESLVEVAARVRVKRPDICTYGCNTCLMNLVGTAACQNETFYDVKRIQCFFKDHTFPRGALTKKIQALEPLVPNEAKWTSQYACMQNFMQNHSAYVEIAKKMDGEMPTDIWHRLNDLIFLNNVNNGIKNLRPIAKALKALQSERAILAHAVNFWIDIKKEVEVPASFTTRFGEIIQLGLPPFACASYLLHPKFRGEGLPPAYSETGLQWLAQKSSQYVSAQMKLSQDDKNYYSTPLMNSDLVEGVHVEKDSDVERRSMSAASWWKNMGKKMGNRLPSGLTELAEKLQLLPASTSSSDKSFSTMGTVMTDTQNRIGGDKASKLYSIYRALYDINDT